MPVGNSSDLLVLEYVRAQPWRMDTTLYILTMVDANPADGLVRFLYLIILHLSTFPVSGPEMMVVRGTAALAGEVWVFGGEDMHRHPSWPITTGSWRLRQEWGTTPRLTAKEVIGTWPKAKSDPTPLHPSYMPIAPQIDR
jgi:hypothetical protein